MSDDSTPTTFNRTDILRALRDAWGVTIPPIKADLSGFEAVTCGDKIGDAIVHSILEDFMPTEVVTADTLQAMIGVLEELTGDIERVTNRVYDVLEGRADDGGEEDPALSLALSMMAAESGNLVRVRVTSPDLEPSAMASPAQLRQARIAGCTAAIEGRPRTDCPHTDPCLASCWRYGWEAVGEPVEATGVGADSITPSAIDLNS